MIMTVQAHDKLMSLIDVSEMLDYRSMVIES